MTWKGKAALKDFQTLDPAGAQLASLKSLSVDVSLFDLNAQRINVNSVVAEAPSVNIAFSSAQTAAKPKDEPQDGTKAAAEDRVQDITIYLQDDAHNDIASWTLVNAWPCKYTGPDFNASSSEMESNFWASTANSIGNLLSTSLA